MARGNLIKRLYDFGFSAGNEFDRMATFMRALRDGNVNDGVLTIDCDPSISYSMGFPPKKSSALFLLRDDYAKLWNDIKTRHLQDMEMKQMIIGS